MMQRKDPILIVGGGIGGLSTAIALRRAGFEVEVFERGPEIREIGAGITLCTNAMVALACLGVADRICELGAHLNRGEFQSSRGNILKRISMTSLEKEFGAPSIGVGRRELLETLHQACMDVPIHTGSRCIGYEEDDQAVFLCLEDGRKVRGSLLIGADGLWSAVRAQLLGGSPRYVGTMSWRGICETNKGAEAEQGSAFVVLGPRSIRGGGWYVDDKRVSWFFGFNTPAGGKDEPGKLRSHLRELLRGWSGPLPSLIENTPEDQMIRTDLYVWDEVDKWGEGRVTLLGDAAHAMGNAIGQGAAQAIEDGVVLADSLQQAPDLVAGLRLYEQRRIPRVRLIIGETRHTGKSMHLENPYLCWIRNMTIRAYPVKKVLDRYRLVMNFEDGARILSKPPSAESRMVRVG